jgi:hypothetical protein
MNILFTILNKGFFSMGSMCVLQQFDLSYTQYLNPDFKPHPLLCALNFLMSLRFLPSLFSNQRDETAST